MTSNQPLSPCAAARLLDAVQAQEPSAIIPGYTLMGILGAGAGGTVHLALRKGSQRPVALKVLAAPIDDRGAGRAWRELDVLSQLRLDCVPRVVDYGIHQSRLFIATEFIEGMPLDRAAQALDTRGRVELLARVAEAVQAVHERGVIHRDLKPSNILIDPSGRPTIIDLGIASIQNPSVAHTLTADGSLIGTPAFMAPEQASGAFAEISTRSDVYALGATAMVILTGHTPHDVAAPLVEVIRRVADLPARDPRALDPTLPGPLAAVLRKALEHDPARRYASPADLADDLRRWTRGLPVTAQPPGLSRRVARWAAAHPLLCTGLACASFAAATLAATVTAVWWANQAPFAVLIDEPKRRWAMLVARSGAILAQWHGDIGLAELVRRSSPSDTPVVVLHLLDTSLQGSHGRLEVVEAKTQGRVLWSSTDPHRRLHAPLPSLPGQARAKDDLMHVSHAILDDIFPDSPDPEIVAVHSCSTSRRAIRIFSLQGDVLFEAWHDGHIGKPVWLAEDQLLIFAGDNADHDWRELGHDVDSPYYPHVVFAIRPEMGQHRRWIRPEPNAPSPDLPAAWYRCFFPPERREHLAVPVAQAWRPADPTQHEFSVYFGLLDGDGGYTVIMTAAGQIAEVRASDRYRLLHPEDSPPKVWVGALPASPPRQR